MGVAEGVVVSGVPLPQPGENSRIGTRRLKTAMGPTARAPQEEALRSAPKHVAPAKGDVSGKTTRIQLSNLGAPVMQVR